MKKPLFLDVETTSIDGKVVQLCYEYDWRFVNEFIDPEEEIDLEAMCVHHITNEMVRGKSTFESSVFVKKLQKLLDSWEFVVVAHNAPFDVGILRKQGMIIDEYICTMKLSQTLQWEEDRFNMSKVNLQYLRYFFGVNCDEEINPHDAYSDVVVLKWLYNVLQKEFEWVEEMIDISMQPVLLKKIWFGKYKWKLFETVKREDPRYLRWVKDNFDNEDVVYTCKFYLWEI